MPAQHGHNPRLRRAIFREFGHSGVEGVTWDSWRQVAAKNETF
jgi:hypothetical protein